MFQRADESKPLREVLGCHMGFGYADGPAADHDRFHPQLLVLHLVQDSRLAGAPWRRPCLSMVITSYLADQ